MIIAAIILSVALLVGFIYIITKVDDPDVELAETKAEMFKGMAK
ncbi:MAG TPA: hypothetical protein PLM72_13205 [Spirochaetota bacterium]|jgi:uncharacterized protein YoxC|nr:hypothetical protein [Spirochaetota bacterium]